MLQSAWLGIGFIALCATAVAVSTKTKGAMLFPNDDGVAIYSGVVGFIAWGFVAYGSLNVRVAGDSTVHSFSMPSVTLFAVMMAVVPGFIALTGPVDIVRRARDGATLEDV
jgi:hypothetical protein